MQYNSPEDCFGAVYMYTVTDFLVSCKVKKSFSLCLIEQHAMKWRYSSMQSQYSVELSGYLQSLVALPLVKEPLVRVRYEAAWVPMLLGCTFVINCLFLELNA